MRDWRDTTVGWVFALYVATPGYTPHIPYSAPRLPGITAECRWVWPPYPKPTNQTKMDLMT